jgi:magnesium-transporting ATPase (P-type)
VVMLKGAPERVLALCSDPTTDNSGFWLQEAEKFARNGMRVLGLAVKVVDLDYVLPDSLSPASLPERFSMVSLVGIMDPPRPEAVVAVKEAQQAGITVKMITGDHPSTAAAIGRLLGLCEERCVAITGRELDQIATESQQRFDETVLNHDVFARTTPEHKLRIIESLWRQVFVSSMTGDGVNDAPALKAANIGVAMGITGTEVAKNAANMIITDDNFATIVDAICVGRAVYANLIKIITFVLPSNGGQAFSIIGALIIGVRVPITTLQILWVNMITSVALGIVLAFDKPGRTALKDSPRRTTKGIFGRLLSWRMASVTLMLVLVVLGSYEWESHRHSSERYLRTVAVNALAMAQTGYMMNCRNVRNNLPVGELFGGNPYLYVGIVFVIIFQVLFTYAPGFQYVFETEPLDGVSWGKIVLLVICVFIAVEVDKYIGNKLKEWRCSHRRCCRNQVLP